MSCCSGCVGYAAAERQFGPAVAERDLKSYRKKGPGPTTRLLRDLLADAGAIAALLDESLRHAERVFALSYPREVWYVHAAIEFENLFRWLKRNPFRAFVHPVDRMTGIIERAGFTLVARRQTWQWSADVWTRSSSLP